MLESIRKSDNFRSKCDDFIKHKAPEHSHDRRLDLALRYAIDELVMLYPHFKTSALFSKDKLGRLFREWEELNELQRAQYTAEIEQGLIEFERYKDDIIKSRR
jgi:hypothetical protein